MGAGGLLGAGRARLGFQLLGFLIGLGLLAWALKMAFSEQNQEQFARLGEAPWYEVAALVGLGLATLAINGLIFFVMLLPVRRLGVLDLQAINGVASLLSYLPFKMSLIFRTVVHTRRDRVPLFTIAAWFGAIGVLIPALLAPFILASLVWRELDLVWIALSLGGVAVVAGLVMWLARLFGPGAGLERVRRWADAARIGLVSRFVRSAMFAHLHAGVVMLASGRAVWSCAGLRVMDVAVQALRFKLAAGMLGFELSWLEAAVSGIVYLFIGASAPTGSLGVREIGTIGVAGLLGVAGDGDVSRFAPVALMVTASEIAAYLIATAGGIVWLRPLRLVRLGRVVEEVEERSGSKGAGGAGG